MAAAAMATSACLQLSPPWKDFLEATTPVSTTMAAAGFSRTHCMSLSFSSTLRPEMIAKGRGSLRWTSTHFRSAHARILSSYQIGQQGVSEAADDAPTLRGVGPSGSQDRACSGGISASDAGSELNKNGNITSDGPPAQELHRPKQKVRKGSSDSCSEMGRRQQVMQLFQRAIGFTALALGLWLAGTRTGLLKGTNSSLSHQTRIGLSDAILQPFNGPNLVVGGTRLDWEAWTEERLAEALDDSSSYEQNIPNGLEWELDNSRNVRAQPSSGRWNSGSVGLVHEGGEALADVRGWGMGEWRTEDYFYVGDADESGLNNELDEEDKEMELEFQRKMSKPRPLTVPLRIVSLQGSVPPLWLKEFLIAQGRNAKVSMKVQTDLGAIVSQLTSSLKEQKLLPQSAMAADLVTIGDAWLEYAVSSGVLSQLKGSEDAEWFQNLSPILQSLLRRDEKGRLSPHGSVYAAPYRVGAAVIAFRHDLFNKHGIPPIKEWADLWHPRLAGRVAMVDSPREVVGATLKSLGCSYNVNSFEEDVPGGRQAVAERFTSLRKQVRLFDSRSHLKALKGGDVFVAVGWSGDVLPFAQRSSQVTVVTPNDGTSLWADLWAVPAATKLKSKKVGGRIRGPSPLVSQWIDFCLQPARAQSFQQEVFVGMSPSQIPHKLESPSLHAGLITLNRGSTISEEDGSSRVSVVDKKTDLDLVSTMGHKTGDKELEKNVALSGGVLSLEILSKSEFLRPLSDSAVEDYRWLFTLGRTAKGDSWHGRLGNLLPRLPSS